MLNGFDCVPSSGPFHVSVHEDDVDHRTVHPAPVGGGDELIPAVEEDVRHRDVRRTVVVLVGGVVLQVAPKSFEVNTPRSVPM